MPSRPYLPPSFAYYGLPQITGYNIFHSTKSYNNNRRKCHKDKKGNITFPRRDCYRQHLLSTKFADVRKAIKEELRSFLVPVAEFTCFPSEIEESLLQYQESLKVLELGEMPHLQSLPSSLENFTSLKIFRIYSSPELKSLPRMPPASLKELKIYGCSATLEKRCQENIGSDWPNISHIPSIEITADIEDEKW